MEIDETENSVTLVPTILRLPNELLDLIAFFVMPSVTVHVMEGTGLGKKLARSTYVSGRSPSSRTLVTERLYLRNLALVCRRFPPIVERWMYQHIVLPQPPAGQVWGFFSYPSTSLPYLVRTLFDRPDLAARVKSLDIWLCDRRLVKDGAERDLTPRNPFFETPRNPFFEMFRKACAHLCAVQATFVELVSWSNQLHQFEEVALHAILISMLPDLRDLKLYAPTAHPIVAEWYMSQEKSPTPEHAYLDVALRNTSLESIYVGVPYPLKQFPASSLTVMEIDVLFFCDRPDWLESRIVLHKVHTVKVVMNLAFLADIRYEEVDTQPGLNLFLRYIVPNIRNFSIDAPRGTLPLIDTDKWDLEQSRAIALDEDPEVMELNMVDDEDLDIPFWAWVLKAIEPLNDRLTRLTFPRNWCSAPWSYVKPLHSLRHFRCLEHLGIPRVAINGNAPGENYNTEEHETSAVKFLPTTIKSLTISQVDTETCQWVQKALERKDLFPEWEEIELVFQKDFAAVLSFGFEDAARNARVKVTAVWREQRMVL